MKKVFIIGIDGGQWDIINSAIEKGYMPTLKSLKANGCHGKLKSTVPTITPAAWGSFQTGVSPALNGVFDFSFFDRKCLKKRYVTSDMLQKTIWRFVSEAGGKVSSINVPMTFPPYPINGYMISGITTPSENSNFTFPIELKEEIKDKISDYHIFTLRNTQKEFIHRDIDSFIQDLKNIISNRTELAKLIIRKQTHNLFMVHFQASDVLQHILWPYLDTQNPLFSKDKYDKILKEFYSYIDSKIHETIQEFKKKNTDDFATVVLSDHGFESHLCRINIGNWLVENNYTKIKSKKTSLLKKLTRKLRIGKILKKIIGEKTTLSIEKKVGIRKELIDWKATSAISIGRSGEGYVYVLEDRPEIKDKLIEEISLKLASLSYRGTKVVNNIFKPENLYGVKCPENFPDLMIIPESGFSFTGNIQLNEGLFSPVTIDKDFHMGKHHIDGIFIAEGKDVKNCEIEANITDIMPTILNYLDIASPQYIQGNKLDIFNFNLNDKKSDIQLSEVICPQDSEEDSDVEKRLSDLGYL